MIAIFYFCKNKKLQLYDLYGFKTIQLVCLFIIE